MAARSCRKGNFLKDADADDDLDEPRNPEKDAAENRRIEELAALIPEELVIALLRAADAETLAMSDALLTFSDETTEVTWREITPQLTDDEVRTGVPMIRCSLVRAWVQLLWLCTNDDRLHEALLGKDLLPLQRSDFLIEQGWNNWLDSITDELEGNLYPEAAQWLYRVFIARLLPQIDAICSADPRAGYEVCSVDDNPLVIHRHAHQHAPYMVTLGLHR